MIVYANDKNGFIQDVPNIDKILRVNIEDILGEEASKNEILSWHNSLRFMANVMRDENIPNDIGIALEYNIPSTNNRIDFLITGTDENGELQAIIVELKQWSRVFHTNKDAIVETYYEEGLKDTVHPSYQAASYASLLSDFKEVVQKRGIFLHPCTYLHNCEDDREVRHIFYKEYTDKAPVFCKEDTDKLRDFIKRFVRKGDQKRGIYEIEKSKIVPSKSLIDYVVSMSKGNKEFKMIDDQKIVYQNILHTFKIYQETGKKQVVIIQGGPGTGKSVISVRLLFRMTRKKYISHYITKNSAPRNVFLKKLTDGSPKAKPLFQSSSKYVLSNENEFDMLIVDEAHRLTEKSNLYRNSGENQVKEIINASKVAVFFIDEHQRVSIDDIGSTKEIEKWAKFFKANITHYELKSQFRCNGSDEYIRWLDRLLQIEEKPIKPLSLKSYDFRVFDSPTEMMKCLKKHNKKNKARMVAGYCWDWKSRNNANSKIADIVFPEYGFAYKWNFSNDKTWCISPNSIDQIGCIHTCQGLELDYVGVIIGPDIICRNGEILVNPSKRSSEDRTIRGYKTMMEKDPINTKKLIKELTKNTYRTLMTRGMKGCFVYVMDEELKEYIKNNLSKDDFNRI